MAGTLSAIYRYPVKGLGPELLDRAALAPGRHLAGDRRWAVAHGSSKWDPAAPIFVSRRNFVQTAMSPELAATELSSDGGVLTLIAPDREPLSADPDEPAGAALITAWLEGLVGHRQPGPYRLASLPGGALTDTEDGHLSLLSDVSLRALSQAAGRPLERRRFRGNLWIDGLAPWEEFDLVGREVSLGGVRLRVTGRIDRCSAPAANPATGARDIDVVAVLRDRWEHIDFGVHAQVIEGGEIALGDSLAL